MPVREADRESDGKTILLTDGEARAALATTRSLGRAGYDVHVSSDSGRSLAGASRWCDTEHAVGSAEIDASSWARKIEALAIEIDAHVLPMTEVAIGSLFASGCDQRIDLIAPSRTDYEAAIDKYDLVERSIRLDIDAPQTTLIEDFGAFGALPDKLRYPVVVKSRRSRMLSGNRWHAPAVRVIADPADLEEAAAGWLPEHGDTILQEFIPGHGEGLFALCQRGELLACFAHRRLREKPPQGGVSVLRESVEIAKDVRGASESLLADLGYSGIAMVEYRRAPDGRLTFMEINPRPWGSMQLAVDAGIDFPRLMTEAHRGNPIPSPMPVARAGVRCRWLLGDLDHWIACARSRSLRKSLDTTLIRISFAFVASFFDGSRLEVLRASDPRPFFRECLEWFAALRGD